jgi:DNA-binding NarL/FixJ family response regulator
MSDETPVLYAVEGAVALMTLNRPEKRNALNDALVAGLKDALRRADADAEVRVVLLTGAGDDELGMRGLRAGAAGYLSKEMELASLPRALRGSLDGEAAISRRLAMQLVQHYRTAPTGGMGLRPVRSSLTDREWEVLDLLSGGATTDDIARVLVLSTETVRSHLKNLYRKLGVRSRDEAVEAAIRMRELGGGVHA